MTEFFEARIRAESQDCTFDAHQATARAAAIEDLVTLRRQYRELSEAELTELAASWRSDSESGPYFVFTAATLNGGDGDGGPNSDVNENRDAYVAVAATFVRTLFHELGSEAPAALAALLDQWTEQRGYARRSNQRPIPARPPRVALLLSRTAQRWAPESWDGLEHLGLEAPEFDGTLLRWDVGSGLWLTSPLR